MDYAKAREEDYRLKKQIEALESRRKELRPYLLEDADRLREPGQRTVIIPVVESVKQYVSYKRGLKNKLNVGHIPYLRENFGAAYDGVIKQEIKTTLENAERYAKIFGDRVEVIPDHRIEISYR